MREVLVLMKSCWRNLVVTTLHSLSGHARLILEVLSYSHYLLSLYCVLSTWLTKGIKTDKSDECEGKKWIEEVRKGIRGQLHQSQHGSKVWQAKKEQQILNSLAFLAESGGVWL